MNVKPVELQIAITRTQEASEVHQQQQQRPATEQMLLNEQAEKMTKKRRERNEQVETAQEARIRDKAKRDPSHADGSGPESEPAAPLPAVPAEHPYKGNHIDFTC
ncbi:hypothetical protein [Paenibacillus popilliae]|uniref:Uncharacterized protein n=1 Tax=Paenibacillus popilliae ATCC 14706 TaxID=1212764 RepID=M9LQJ2_PAEPP|nr:hypothetical protein [Paenibacillus popilliae]GAC43156.1 hypothetical protein PPOP_2523 [Paenibacillus popilliae ATCC 14706]